MSKNKVEKVVKEDIEKVSANVDFFTKWNEIKEKIKAENAAKKQAIEAEAAKKVVVENPVKEEPIIENVVILQEPSERAEERFNKERTTRKTKSIKKETK